MAPEWRDDDLPVLRSLVAEEGYLKTQFITLIFLNKAKKSDYQGNENLGQCTVPLEECSEFGTPFEVEVTLGGKSQGKLTGVIQMTFTPAETSRRKSWMADDEEDYFTQRVS